jgi:outer membrane lipoprotein-sorting protein
MRHTAYHVSCKVRVGRLLSGVLLLVLCASPAGAYILRGPHIVDLMVSQMGRPDTLLITQRVSYHDKFFKQGVVEARETLRYVFPDTFRSDSTSAYAQQIRLTARGDGLTVVNGRIAVADSLQFDVYQDLLLYRSRSLLLKKLSDLGVETGASSLDRFEGGIVLVLGTVSPSERVSQVWVDKETFKPVRWLIPGQDDGGRHLVREIRYLDWRQVNSVWYPMQMQFYEDGILLREIRVEGMKVNPTFPKELFDVARLRFKVAAQAQEADKEAVSEELNEVQETIDEFRKKYE